MCVRQGKISPERLAHELIALLLSALRCNPLTQEGTVFVETMPSWETSCYRWGNVRVTSVV
ncbi:MAG: hypothetical protein RMJ98_10755 [Myxococcales bacterium]|nr:hypothetical protein [Myxococcales bacterium]